jgi:hypothetical protein
MTRPQRRRCLRGRLRQGRLLSSRAGVCRSATTKQPGDKETEQQACFHPLPLIIGIIWHFCDRIQGAGVLQSAAGALTDFRTFAGKATLPEPWEVAAHVCYAPKTKSLNCLGANVRDGFFNRIGRENQI